MTTIFEPKQLSKWRIKEGDKVQFHFMRRPITLKKYLGWLEDRELHVDYYELSRELFKKNFRSKNKMSKLLMSSLKTKKDMECLLFMMGSSKLFLHNLNQREVFKKILLHHYKNNCTKKINGDLYV